MRRGRAGHDVPAQVTVFIVFLSVLTGAPLPSYGVVFQRGGVLYPRKWSGRGDRVVMFEEERRWPGSGAGSNGRARLPRLTELERGNNGSSAPLRIRRSRRRSLRKPRRKASEPRLRPAPCLSQAGTAPVRPAPGPRRRSDDASPTQDMIALARRHGRFDWRMTTDPLNNLARHVDR